MTMRKISLFALMFICYALLAGCAIHGPATDILPDLNGGVVNAPSVNRSSVDTTITVPVRVTFDAIKNLISTKFLTDQGRHSLCSGPCTGLFNYANVEMPEVSANGNKIAIRMHIGAEYNLLGKHGAQGHVTITGVPSIIRTREGGADVDYLVLKSFSSSLDTPNVIVVVVNALKQFFTGHDFLSDLEKSLKLDLTPLYKEALGKISEKFPFELTKGVTLNMVTKGIEVRSIRIVEAQKEVEILVNIKATITI